MRARRDLLAAATAFLLCAVPVVLASMLLFDRQREARAEETRLLADQAALRLADFVRARLLALEIVRRESAHPSFEPDERFDSLADATETEYGGFRAINWIDADGIVRRVMPRDSNLAALGQDLVLHAPARDSVQQAYHSREPRATPPLALLQGGRGFATYFPVVRDGEVVGAVNGVFRIDALVESCLGDVLLERYDVVLDDEGRAVYGDVASLGEHAQTAPRPIPILDRSWRLRLDARTGSRQFDLAVVSFLVVGLALALAIAVATFFAVRKQQARLEREREEHRRAQRAAQAQRLEALGRLAGGVAHDFNNLLAVILAAGEIALRRGGDSMRPEVRESLEDAVTAAERATALTRQLLAFAREQPLQPRRLDLREVVRTTERLLRRLVREDVELAVRCPDEDVWVQSDAVQLTQVIVNLVVNASDALAGPGHVDVSLEVREGRGGREPSGRWAVLEVRDDGPGISPDVLDHLYEPFFTTRAERGGTGLGLATVYGVLQQHGGHVVVESEVGRGATFRAFFPLASEDAPSVAVREGAPAPSTRHEDATVLLVEDEALLRRTAKRALTSIGYRVLEAVDGAEALAKLEEPGHTIDVIVSDLVMPRMGGLDLLRALRARGERAPAILVSGHADVAVSTEELRALTARFVAKPYTAGELRAVVAEAVASARALDTTDHHD